MKSEELRDLYTDYLIVQNQHATSTGCSDLVDNLISHDSFTRLLSKTNYDSKYLWQQSKDFVRAHENDCGVLSIDNSILHKTYSAINEVVNWHYDHGVSRVVKGMNLLSIMVNYGAVSIPVAYDAMIKDQICIKQDKHGKDRFGRKSRYSLNEMARALVKQVLHNKVEFRYLTADTWFCSKENLNYFHQHKLSFVLGLASNRLVAIDRQSRHSGNYVSVKDLELNDGAYRKVYLKGVSFCVVVTRKVFKNGDASIGELYLVTNDLTLTSDHMYEIYQKRWKIEEYHRSIKQNVSICKSPTKVKKTQLNHICLSLLAYSELEQLKVSTTNHHYALKRRMLIAANQASYRELQKIKNERMIVM